MCKNQKLGVILNPIAGRGRAHRIENGLVEHLRRLKISFSLEKSNYEGHATQIAKQMSNEFPIIIAAGGDGTVNEVASGIFCSKAAIALLPIGSGNDFNKLIGMPTKVNFAVDIIIKGRKKLFDFGRISIRNSFDQTKERHFINMVGIGIDAEIARKAKQIKYLRGLFLYLVAAIKALSTYSPIKYTINDGNILLTQQAYLLCAGNGNYEGGGFKMLPNANPHDSMLNICLIKAMPLLRGIPLIPKIIKGTHGNDKMVSMWDSKSLHVSSHEPFIIHGDGEILEENAIDVMIEMEPKKINVIVP